MLKNKRKGKLVILLLAGCCTLVAQNCRIYVVDTQTTYQQIDNFSASDAWRIHFIGKHWPVEKRNQLADWLFSTDFDEKGNPRGMGLSNWRVNIGAGSYDHRDYEKEVKDTWNQTECFLAPDGTYDFSKQAGQQWFMNAARKRGMNNFLFFTNSAPYFMNRSASTVATDNHSINLMGDKMNDFSEFLACCVRHFQKQGYGVNYISPINEPDVEWNTNSMQEGTAATKNDIRNVVLALDKAITDKGLKTKIIIPEVGDFKYLFEVSDSERVPDDMIHAFFSKKAPYDVSSCKNLYNCVAAHDYWSAYPPSLLVDMRTKVRNALDKHGLGTKFWASEYCILEKNEDVSMPDSPQKSISRALYVARLIHMNLTVANASAWQWWTAVAFGEEVPVRMGTKPGASFESLKYNGELFANKLLWATANFSFFIRPGMKRVKVGWLNGQSTPLEDATSLMVSSFVGKDKLVTVFINYSTQDERVKLKCELAKKGKMYLTAIDKDLAYQGEKALNNLCVPARSIATVVVQK